MKRKPWSRKFSVLHQGNEGAQGSNKARTRRPRRPGWVIAYE
jgi:hypothetical protein